MRHGTDLSCGQTDHRTSKLPGANSVSGETLNGATCSQIPTRPSERNKAPRPAKSEMGPMYVARMACFASAAAKRLASPPITISENTNPIIGIIIVLSKVFNRSASAASDYTQPSSQIATSASLNRVCWNRLLGCALTRRFQPTYRHGHQHARDCQTARKNNEHDQ